MQILENILTSQRILLPQIMLKCSYRTRDLKLEGATGPRCVCVCVFNSMCVLERAADRPNPTERCCVVYDFSRGSRCILSFPGVSGRDMRTAATPAPDQPGPPKAPPSPARASRLKQSAPLQRIGAAFMPGQSGRDLSLAQE